MSAPAECRLQPNVGSSRMSAPAECRLQPNVGSSRRGRTAGETFRPGFAEADAKKRPLANPPLFIASAPGYRSQQSAALRRPHVGSSRKSAQAECRPQPSRSDGGQDDRPPGCTGKTEVDRGWEPSREHDQKSCQGQRKHDLRGGSQGRQREGSRFPGDSYSPRNRPLFPIKVSDEVFEPTFLKPIWAGL